jgi:hypothetical protein
VLALEELVGKLDQLDRKVVSHDEAIMQLVRDPPTRGTARPAEKEMLQYTQ